MQAKTQVRVSVHVHEHVHAQGLTIHRTLSLVLSRSDPTSACQGGCGHHAPVRGVHHEQRAD
jgi:hypothetical protein